MQVAAQEHKPITKCNVRLVAFYLPQFHPIKENDEWWGKGFTEWTNVTKAEPLFPGHQQPHLPTELGFYDLRVREVRREQISLAKNYGVDAFCYYYYWFSGKRLLETPLEDMLADTESDMPFCLCWANENWTRRWNGGEQDILIEQQYRAEDALEFIKGIAAYIKDPRYLKIDGKPILLIYRPQLIPDTKKTVSVWREYCAQSGIGEIHLSAVLTFGNFDYEKFGFDSGVEFPPHNRHELGARYVNQQIRFYRPFDGGAMMFHELATAYLKRVYQDKNIFRGVFPSWDNTARSKHRALVLLNGTPGNYEYWLDQAIKKTQKEYPEKARLVFINAWNEWAEGCHLEPDSSFEKGFLEATLRAKRGHTCLTTFPHAKIPEEARIRLRALLTELGNDLDKYGSFLKAILYEQLKKILLHNPKLKQLMRTVFARFTAAGQEPQQNRPRRD